MAVVSGSFELWTRLTRLSLATCGFAALGLGGQLGPVLAVCACIGLGATLANRRPSIAPRLWTSAQLIMLLWIALGLGLLRRQPLTVFAELLVFIQVHRLLSCRSARDEGVVALIAFAQLLLATVLTIAPLFFPLYLVFSLSLVFGLCGAQLRASVERRHAFVASKALPGPSAFASLSRICNWRTLVLGGLVGGVAVASSVLLFFILPRAQGAFLPGHLLPRVAVSGFSDRVRLGEVGTMQLSNAPVFRAVLTDVEGRPAGGEGLYWRGLALDRFTGMGWELSETERVALSALHDPKRGGPPRQRPWTLEQELRTEALDQEVLFFAGKAVGIYGSIASLEAYSTYGFASPGSGRKHYRIYSDTRLPLPQEARVRDPRRSPPGLLLRYTQLPSGLSPRFQEIAEEWTRGAEDPVDEVLLIAERLRRDFAYSLDQEAGAFEDPLLAFLEEVREGHCEYFASAMAVLLRTRGLPARLVNGFAGGSFNEVGGYWLVRQRDAHSWVEVHFPELGWLRFDPTPDGVGGAFGSARRGFLHQLASLADYGADLWSRALLDYGAEHQSAALRKLWVRWMGVRDGGAFRGLVKGEGSEGGQGVWWKDGPGLTGSYGVPLLGSAFFALVVGLWHRWRQQRRRFGREAAWLRPRILRSLRRWRRLGHRARRAGEEGVPVPHASILEWAEWVAKRDAQRWADAPVRVLHYYALRFGK